MSCPRVGPLRVVAVGEPREAEAVALVLARAEVGVFEGHEVPAVRELRVGAEVGEVLDRHGFDARGLQLGGRGLRVTASTSTPRRRRR